MEMHDTPAPSITRRAICDGEPAPFRRTAAS
jgi:hypothetical protein